MDNASKKLLKISEELLEQEIKKTGLPPIDNHKICLKYGSRLAKIYGLDEDFVLASLNFMDVKVGEAFLKNKREAHVQMSLEATLSAIKSLEIEKREIIKLTDCIISHHGAKKYPSIEAEVCANADSFKFLHPRGFVTMIASLRKRGIETKAILELMGQKLDEKIKTISLPEVTAEAKSYYKKLRRILEKSNK